MLQSMGSQRVRHNLATKQLKQAGLGPKKNVWNRREKVGFLSHSQIYRSLRSYVTADNLLNLSEPPFSHLRNKYNLDTFPS